MLLEDLFKLLKSALEESEFIAEAAFVMVVHFMGVIAIRNLGVQHDELNEDMSIHLCDLGWCFDGKDLRIP